MSSALLLSGGMDSACIAFWQRPELAITVDYGQLAAQAERSASAAICRSLGIRHEVITLDCRSLGSGDMAGHAANLHAPASDWWPFRNQFLVTVAAMKAMKSGASRLLLGTVSTDASHADGSPEFVAALSQLMESQEGGLRVEAPAADMTTLQLIKSSGTPRSLLAWAHSCHKSNIPCWSCRGCNKHFEVLKDLASNA